MNEPLIQPFTVRMFTSKTVFDFFIINESALNCINKEHFSRFKASFFYDLIFRDIQNSDFT